MKKTLTVLAIATFTLVACKKTDSGLIAQPPPAASGGASDANAAMAPTHTPSADAAADQARASIGVAASPTPPMLALAYKLGLVVPADQVRPLMESHQEACERAGTDQCQVMGANADADGDDRVSAELSLRASPAWMRLFRTRAEADAKDLGGRIDEAATQAEDLTAPIVDTRAAQQARAAEQQRLAELMKHRTRNLDQTLQVDQAITDTQSQIDQASSELAAMKGRVAMQTMTVSYQSAAAAQPKGSAAPLEAAARGFMGNVYGVLAVLVTLASVILPVGLIAWPIVWWANRRRKPKTPAASANRS